MKKEIKSGDWVRVKCDEATFEDLVSFGICERAAKHIQGQVCQVDFNIGLYRLNVTDNAGENPFTWHILRHDLVKL